jgi:hypothetical protein
MGRSAEREALISWYLWDNELIVNFVNLVSHNA